MIFWLWWCKPAHAIDRMMTDYRLRWGRIQPVYITSLSLEFEPSKVTENGFYKTKPKKCIISQRTQL